MDPKPYSSPPSPPPAYNQSMLNTNNGQFGSNQPQQNQYQPPYQPQSFPMQPQMAQPVVTEQGL